MDLIEYIRKAFENDDFIFTRHAAIKGIQRKISLQEISEAIEGFEVIEEYPNDKYLPSCLILGFTKNMRPLHIQLTTDSSSTLKIITIYEPDDDKWDDSKKYRR